MQTFRNGDTLVVEGIHYIRQYVNEGNVMDFNSFPLDYYGLYGNLDITDRKITPKYKLVNTADTYLQSTQDVAQSDLTLSDMYDISMALKYKPKPECSQIKFVVAEYDFSYMDTIIRKGEYYPENYIDFEPLGKDPVKWVDYQHKCIYHVVKRKQFS